MIKTSGKNRNQQMKYQYLNYLAVLFYCGSYSSSSRTSIQHYE